VASVPAAGVAVAAPSETRPPVVAVAIMLPRGRSTP